MKLGTCRAAQALRDNKRAPSMSPQVRDSGQTIVPCGTFDLCIIRDKSSWRGILTRRVLSVPRASLAPCFWQIKSPPQTCAILPGCHHHMGLSGHTHPRVRQTSKDRAPAHKQKSTARFPENWGCKRREQVAFRPAGFPQKQEAICGGSKMGVTGSIKALWSVQSLIKRLLCVHLALLLPYTHLSSFGSGKCDR